MTERRRPTAAPVMLIMMKPTTIQASASSVAVERMIFEQEIQEASSFNDDDAADR